APAGTAQFLQSNEALTPPNNNTSRFQALDLLATLVAVVRGDGYVIFANSALEDAIGSSRRTIEGSSFPSFFKRPEGLPMEIDGGLKEYTRVIIHEADRLQTLVDRLLAPHRKPHVVSDVNIHEVCERVRSLILAEFPKGLKVVRDYDASIPEFRGDREQLIQAVLNIAHNAAQALSDRIAGGDAQLTFRTRISRQVTFGKQRYRLALELHVI